MRTTVTLDPDADARVRALMKERGLTFKQAINAAIVEGAPRREAESIATPTFAMGRERVDLDRALALSGALEDDELVRKMRLGK
ncbi:antitoxin [Paramicrobacterium agarici]|uniref:Antitoxin n=1 Tax=Paramicrobacterium agarici TaxID=630514 RepID=A0A2A9DWN7_9MICO|nr:antitoxin [Microbacterium agarici]PFG30761.1 hypothetical protein ATJ78_1698 [Microbacterium agarici]TQO23763.1 hypothetical protein FB385_2623 [Microbacterium agarici]